MANPVTIPEKEVADRLAAAGLSLVQGTNLFYHPIKPVGTGIPAQCTFCFDSQSGPKPHAYFGNTPSKRDFREFWIQVVHRAKPDDWSTGLAFARSIWAALHRTTPSGTGYFSLHCRDSEPMFMGIDNQECPRWTINTVLWYKG